MKLFIPIFVSILLSSCMKNDLEDYYGREGMFTMRPAFMGKMPQGDDSYSQGMRDGCNTAIALIGTGPMASSYEVSYQDVNRTTSDRDYSKGYDLGQNYCTYYQDVDPL
jgi:hypothetical protein